MNHGIIFALLAAVLFGLSTPFAKLLTGDVSPVLLAGLLYAGSGIGLSAWRMSRRHAVSAGTGSEAPLSKLDLPWLAGAIFAGGIIGPVLMMTGLVRSTAASASLLLNMEGVFTALLAWFVFREQFDRRIFIGMVLIVVACVLLSWPRDGTLQAATSPWGAACIVGACLCWAIDNNLTRKVSASDAVQIAAIKGLVAGTVNLGIALFWMNAAMPAWHRIAFAGVLGFAGYGLSLVLFVLALRHLGTARTGAYFSAAPFVGAALSLFLPGESPDVIFWLAAGLMASGIWLHVTESHIHPHTHEEMAHDHAHVHDAHHQHEHDFPWDGREPHSHPHLHRHLTHTHPHFPDIHHRHSH